MNSSLAGRSSTRRGGRAEPGGLGRRLAQAGAIALLALMLSACSSVHGARENASGEGVPVAGGVLRVGTTADLEPAAIFADPGDTGRLLIAQVYDTLVSIPADGQAAKPRLATSWRITGDGRSITLALRDDVTFQSGRSFTSEDVEFSIRTWADLAWSAPHQPAAAAITGFDAAGPHRITLRSEHPISDLIELLDVVPIIDSQTFDQLAAGEDYVGTGPFRFESWTPGSTLVLARNDDYWDGPAYLDRVEVHVAPDARSLVLQLRNGRLDLVQGASSWDIESLSRQRYFEPIETGGRRTQADPDPALAVAEVEGVGRRCGSELSFARAWLDR